MKNGTSTAVLVTDLLAADGPARALADDFVAARCSRCADPAELDLNFYPSGYLCARCGARVGFS